MNVGKTLFAQIMKFVPWTSFGRIVDRYAKLLCTGHLTNTRVAAARQRAVRDQAIGPLNIHPLVQ